MKNKKLCPLFIGSILMFFLIFYSNPSSAYYGLGGLYSSMYGLYGAGGLGGILGLGSLLSGLGLLNPTTSTQTAGAAAEALLPSIPLSAQLFLAEQTGTWVGTWVAATGETGDMTLDIVEDPATGAASAFTVLVFRAYPKTPAA